ncbi:hypothetical protein [Flavobacterium sp.]|uniref:hypothetical protein n=1 Tax=Flavobacterium sp. TaxID=239 RepID=UPI003B9A9345
MEKPVSLRIKIKDLKEISYSTQITHEILDNFKEENVDMRLSFMVIGTPADVTLELRLFLEYRYKKELGKPKTFFSLACSTTFGFDNLDENSELITLGENESQIADPLMIRLLNISLGTLRGYAASKMAVLPINLIMPLVDPKKMIETAKKAGDIKETRLPAIKKRQVKKSNNSSN